jgi:hypothetical protein
MTCQIQPCTKPGELACTLGGTSRRVICIDHQVRIRTAALMGGRSIVVHHGVDLDTWRADDPPVEDVPDLGLPHSQAPSTASTFPPAHEYDRGRSDERAAVAEYLRRWEPGLARAIGRGDHLEGK